MKFTLNRNMKIGIAVAVVLVIVVVAYFLMKKRTPPSGQTQTSTPPSGQTQTSTPPSGQTQTSTQPSGQTQTSTQPSGQTQTSTQPSGQTQAPTNILKAVGVTKDGKTTDYGYLVLEDGNTVTSTTDISKATVVSIVNTPIGSTTYGAIKTADGTKFINIGPLSGNSVIYVGGSLVSTSKEFIETTSFASPSTLLINTNNPVPFTNNILLSTTTYSLNYSIGDGGFYFAVMYSYPDPVIRVTLMAA